MGLRRRLCAAPHDTAKLNERSFRESSAVPAAPYPARTAGHPLYAGAPNRSRNARLRIFPDALRGKSATKCTRFGTLKGARRSRA